MRKIICLLALVILISGCAVTTRMARLKDRNENVLSFQVKGTIQEVKQVIKEIAKEKGLIEVSKVEADDFMLIRTNMLKGAGANLLFGSLAGAMVTKQTRLGFFFEYDAENNTTTVTITEEVSSIVSPSRFDIADRIKLRLANKK